MASIFVSPVLGYKFIQVKTKEEKEKEAREKGKSWKSSIGDKAYRIFYKLIALCIHFKKTVIVGTAGLFCLTLAMIPLVNQEFFPDSVRPEIILDVNLPSGASIQETKRVMNGIADTLYGDERVSSFSTYIGDTAPRFILLFDPKAPEDGHGQMIIVATDQKSRDALRKEIMDTVTEKYPDAQAHTRLITTGPPSEYPVMFRLSGESIDETVKLASEALSIMKQNPDVTNASLDWPQETPTLKLKINQDKVRELGIDNYAVSQDLYVKLSGYKVAESYQGDQLIPIWKEIMYRVWPA